MFKIKITNAERFDSIPDNSTLIDVAYDIVESVEGSEDVVVSSYRESFPLNSTREDIEAQLQKKLKSFEDEKAREEKQSEIDESLEQADATIEALRGVEVLSTEENIQ